MPQNAGALQGRTVAVTGASGSLGQALLRHLHQQGAELVALSSSPQPLVATQGDGQPIPLQQLSWRCGEEQALATALEAVDVLVINHGLNVHGNRSPEAVLQSLEVNALSSCPCSRLLIS